MTRVKQDSIDKAEQYLEGCKRAREQFAALFSINRTPEQFASFKRSYRREMLRLLEVNGEGKQLLFGVAILIVGLWFGILIVVKL